MVSRGPWYRSPHLALFGDACLLTAGVFTLCLAVGGGLVWLLQPGDGTVSAVIMAILGPVFTFAGVFAGPLAAWRLNGRRVSGAAVLGALFGMVVTAVAVVALIALMLTIARPVMGDEAPAALGLATLFGIGLATVMVARLVSAVRDLLSARAAPRLDLALLASAVGVVGFAAVMVWLIVYRPGDEGIEALPFMLAFSLIGGMMTVGASIVAGKTAPPQAEESAASA